MFLRQHERVKQLVLALIVNPDGFPFSYELFDGNRADVTTVEVILRTVERKLGAAGTAGADPDSKM